MAQPKDIQVYEYAKCTTCQKALKYLDAHKVRYQIRPIKEQAPSLAELKQMLEFLKARGGSIKSLFNTSGIQYRELNMSDKLKAGMSEKEALSLLSKNGMLVKRPFLLTSKNGAVGFKEDVWADLLGIGKSK
jgi:arsenate reductase